MSANTVSYGNGAGTDREGDYVHIHPKAVIHAESPLSASGTNALAALQALIIQLMLGLRVDIPGPLESEYPIIPILFVIHVLGHASRKFNFTDIDILLVLHRAVLPIYRVIPKTCFALCDRHVSRGRIVGKWYRCAFCARDLCADCEALDTHDSTHAFLVFKAPVDKQVFRQLADVDNPANIPPVWQGNIYHPQRD
ncbi:hypothetical protein H4582DRAFT_2088826 [Lactarius indigo]|nr:hypothetical protein H4582DRAFT_2088826 [Lactarius indigo]